MQLFYSNKIKDNLAYFDAEESLHCVKSLRKKAGDLINFVDGAGNLFEGRLVEANKRACIATIGKTIENYGRPAYQLHIAIAPTKNNNRFEWFLEKATEIGISRITPLICHRSERRNLRIDRYKKIMVSAIKQSLKSFLPVLDEPVSFKDFIQNQELTGSERYIAHCIDGKKNHLKNLYPGEKDALILIGPEGDFTKDEVRLAKEHKFIEVSLGQSRLRTETAGLVACSVFELLNSHV